MKVHSRLLVALFVVLIFSPDLSSAATWFVSRSGNGDYRTLREAYARANNGDTIEVDDGIFSEGVGEFSPEKRLTISPRARRSVLVGGGAPPNDSFDNRIPLFQGDEWFSGILRGASLELGEPQRPCYNIQGSVWFSLSVLEEGLFEIRFRDFSQDNLRLELYEGSDLGLLRLVSRTSASNPVLRFHGTPRAQYQLAVVATDSVQADFGLSVWRIFGQLPPVDGFSQRSLLVGNSPVAESVSTEGATREDHEPRHEAATGRPGVGRSVWWSWVAPGDGIALLDSFNHSGGINGNPFPHVIAVYTGTELCNLQSVASDYVFVKSDLRPDSAPEPIDPVHFFVRSGQAYHIAIDPTDSDGFAGFGLEFFAHPINDDQANAERLDGDWATGISSTLAATRESGEDLAIPALAAGKTVWWTWTAPPSTRSRPAKVSTMGSKVDTLLSVYVAENGRLRMLGANDDLQTERCTDPERLTTLSSEVNFLPEGGKTYFFGVDGSTVGKSLVYSPRGSLKLLRQYAGDVSLLLDYSRVRLVDVCHYDECGDSAPCRRLRGTLRVSNDGEAATRALRVRFVAAKGFGMTAGALMSTETQNVESAPLNLPPMQPGEDARELSYSDVNYPAPGDDLRQTGGGDKSHGWGVYALLEEQFSDSWLPIHSVIITYGKFPFVAPFGGPNGGPLRSDPEHPKPVLLRSLIIQGPSSLCEGEEVSILGKAVLSTGVVSAQPDWSAEGPVELVIPQDAEPLLLRARTITRRVEAKVKGALRFAGSSREASHGLAVLDNCAVLGQIALEGRVLRAEYVDLPGTKVALESSTGLDPANWRPLATHTVDATGTWHVSVDVLPNESSTFLRVLKLP